MVGGYAMDRQDDPGKRPGSGAREGAQESDRAILCPTCALEPTRVIVLLDTRKGKTVRLFKCECGELVWDD